MCNFLLFYYKLYRFHAHLQQFQIAHGRHLEYLSHSNTCRFWKMHIYSGPLYEGNCQISPLYWEKWWFYDKNNFLKWRLDAILNILVIATLADPWKCTFIRDFYRKVIAKFHLCTEKNNDFMTKQFFKMAAGRHLEYLCPRNRCRSWQVQSHYGLSYEGLCQISALQNHFQTKPLTRALTALCWAT